MSQQPSDQDGFTSVELLVTLFIAAAFIAIGYQLFTSIITDSGAVRQRAVASNIAYDQLRRVAATNPTCTTPAAATTTTIPTPSDVTLGNVVITSKTYVAPPYACPYAGNLMYAEVTVTYGTNSPKDAVTHALYVSK